MDVINFDSVSKIDDRYLNSLFYSKKNELHKAYRSREDQETINDIKFHLAVIQREFQIRGSRKKAHEDYIFNLYGKKNKKNNF